MFFSYQRLDKIFKLIAESESPIPRSELTEQLKVTDRTIRSDIHTINDELIPFDLSLTLLRKQGYVLSDPHTAATNDILSQINEALPDNTESYESRIAFILEILLKSAGPVQIDYLSQRALVSENTIYNYLKAIRGKLADYNLKLRNKTNVGLFIDGSELDKRQLICELIVEKDFSDYVLGFTPLERSFFNEIDLDLLTKIYQKHFQFLTIQIPDFNSKNILFHIALCILRIKESQTLTTQQQDILDITMPDNLEEPFLKLIDDIENNFQILINENEKKYLSLHLSANSAPIWIDSKDFLEDKINDFITGMFTTIYYYFNDDLRSDHVLKHDLTIHLLSTMRMEDLGSTRKNPLLQTIKNNYAMAYDKTLFAVRQNQDKIPLSLSDDEIGYIALHVGAALERSKRGSKGQKTIAIVCGAGIATSRLIEAKIKNEFPNLQISGRYSLAESKLVDLSHNDFIISTIPLTITGVKVITVDFANLSAGLQKVQHLLTSKNETQEKEILTHFLSPEFFLSDYHATSKESLIHELCQHLAEKNKITGNYEESVLEREKIGSSYLGSGIAMPHALAGTVLDSVIYVVILNQAIKWDAENNLVNIIFLPVITIKDTQNLDYFYEKILDMIQNEEAANKILHEKDFQSFLFSFLT